jgi:hypothetical protein
MREKLKRFSLPHLASSVNGEDSLGETLSVAGLITEADFAPLNGGPNSPLIRVVNCFVCYFYT